MARPKENIDPEIGLRIKKIRTKILNVSQKKFAIHYGVTVQTVSNWENGKRKVPDEVIKNLADSLYITEEDVKFNIPIYKYWDLDSYQYLIVEAVAQGRCRRIKDFFSNDALLSEMKRRGLK